MERDDEERGRSGQNGVTEGVAMNKPLLLPACRGSASSSERQPSVLRSATHSDCQIPARPDGRTGVLRDTQSLFQGRQTKGCQAAAGVIAHRSASSSAPLLCLIMAGNHNNISAR